MRNNTEIERLVAESYSALRPSASVEDAVRDSLPAQRPAARRWPRAPVVLSAAAVMLVGVVLALVLATNGREGGEAGPDELGLADGGGEITLPVVAPPATGVVARSNDEITVHVASDGRLLVLSAQNTWEEVSLDGLAAHLRENAGKPGFVVVRADRNAPWRWLQRVMMVCAEAKRFKVALAARKLEGREFRLDATLPVDPGLDGERREMVGRIGVRVKEGSVRYEFGGAESVELASVARWLAGARKATESGGLELVGEVHATGVVPWEHVARLLAEFRQAGIERVEFYGAAPAKAAEREAARLVAPGGVERAAGTGLRRDPPEEEVVEEPIEMDAPAMIFDADTGNVAAIERAAAIVRRRLRAAGLGNLAVVRDGRVLRVESPKDKSLAEVQQLVERKQATLEFHLTVEPDVPNYETYWLRLQRALFRGAKFDEARDVAPTDLARDDRANGRYRAGLRWYRLAEGADYGPDRLPDARERFVLCRNDDCSITEESLDGVVARRTVTGSGWAVEFKVKPGHQRNMARLTGEHGTYLAIIVNDRVRAAPILNSTLSDSGQISGGYTEGEARTLAALLTSEPLPVKFTLVAVERR